MEAARLGSLTNLSAWATAYLETHPEQGVKKITLRYFQDRSRKRAELEEILRAISVVGPAASIHSRPRDKRIFAARS